LLCLLPSCVRLETTLRKYSCLTTGDSILINYNNKRYYIDIFETKPQRAVTIIEARAGRDLNARTHAHTHV
jgi:hypothetical protein